MGIHQEVFRLKGETLADVMSKNTDYPSEWVRLFEDNESVR